MLLFSRGWCSYGLGIWFSFSSIDYGKHFSRFVDEYDTEYLIPDSSSLGEDNGLPNLPI